MKKQWSRAVLVLLGAGAYCVAGPTVVVAQYGPIPSDWRQHENERPRPPVVTPAPHYSAPPPADAVILFDGRDMSGWTGGDGAPARWTVQDGYMQVVPGTGSIQSRERFGDIHLHIEWASPSPAVGTSQNRGNSGVMLMGGRYEVQVLDNYNADTYPDGQAGAIYGQYPPLFNASRPPGEWQTYDIFFRRPRFDDHGRLLEPARLTVVHNGILVQNNEILYGQTTYQVPSPFLPHDDELPLQLQDHSHPVRFRNIWARRMPERPDAPPQYTARPANLSEEQLQRFVGAYFRQPPQGQQAPQQAAAAYTVTREGTELLVRIGNNVPQRAIPVSESQLWLAITGATMTFEPGAGGAEQVTFDMGGARTVAVRRP
jgi:hypothetical protein